MMIKNYVSTDSSKLFQPTVLSARLSECKPFLREKASGRALFALAVTAALD